MRWLSIPFMAVLQGCGAGVPLAPGDALADPSEATLGALDARAAPCTGWSPPAPVGMLEGDALVELSGLAASRRFPGVLYAHNDSGDAARFFVLSAAGATLAEVRLDGAETLDLEDAAIGPCDAATCVFLGDIGDNSRRRASVSVYRVREPQLPLGPPGTPAPPPLVAAWERAVLRYPDGPRDAEALVVDPEQGDVYVLSKEPRGQRSRAYRVPSTAFGAGSAVTMELVTSLSAPRRGAGDLQLSGADVSADGHPLLLRTYNRVLALTREDGAPFSSIFRASPVAVPSAREPQGEAIALAPDGASFVTASERHAAAVPLFRVRCLTSGGPR